MDAPGQVRSEAQPAAGVLPLPRWMRLAVALAALLGLIIVPFLLWGETLESQAPQLLTSETAGWWLAGLGAALLAVDVILPIPSSVVSAGLCLVLGPWPGAFAIVAGMLASYVLGHLLGGLLPRQALRHWIGPSLWDALALRAQGSALYWIMLTRPIPVLAEATAVMAGSLGVPLGRALPAAVLASTGVAACYAAAASLGGGDVPFWLVFAISLLLASLLWGASRLWQDRLQNPPSPPPRQQGHP